MKKKIVIAFIFIVLLLILVPIIFNSKYSKDEISFSKEYSVVKDNGVSYITYSSLLEKLNEKNNIIFLANTKDAKSKKFAKKLVFLVKDYNTKFYYYNTNSNKKYNEVLKKLNIKELNFPILILIKDYKISIYYNASDLDNAFETFYSTTCEKDSMC